jgi:adenosylhomocysteine nucleosidase
MIMKINEISSDKIFHVGIVCAVDEEFLALTCKLDSSHQNKLGDKNISTGTYNRLNIAIIQSGVGNINSAIATSALITCLNPKIMLFSGIAGALNPKCKVGDVLVGKSAFQAEAITHEQLRDSWNMPKLDKFADKNLLNIAESLYEKCRYNVKTGTIVSSDIYPAPKDFEQLFLAKNADAIDMETAAFYQACNTFIKPCLCIRSFSNTVTNSESEELQKEPISVSATNSSEFCFKLIQNLSIHLINNISDKQT